MILVVEDEHQLNQMVCDYLSSRGHQVRGTYDGASALRLVFEAHPQMIILDLNLPGMSGLDLARAVRSGSSLPILMLTARGDEQQRLEGFEAGADDYVTKPFSMQELAYRVEAILRRAAATETDGDEAPIVVGDLVIDTRRRAAHVGSRPVALTTTQFDLLVHMARSPGRVFTRLQLLEAGAGEQFAGYERTIDAHIKNIRRALEDSPTSPRYIATVRGIGYRIEEDRS